MGRILHKCVAQHVDSNVLQYNYVTTCMFTCSFIIRHSSIEGPVNTGDKKHSVYFEKTEVKVPIYCAFETLVCLLQSGRRGIF